MQANRALYDAFWGNNILEYRCYYYNPGKVSSEEDLTKIGPVKSILEFCEHIQGVEFCLSILELLTGDAREVLLQRIARKVEISDLVDAILVHDKSREDFLASSSLAVTKAISGMVGEEVEAHLVKLCDDSIAVRKADGTDLFRFQSQKSIESLFYEFCQNNLPVGSYGLTMNGYKVVDAVEVKG